MNAPADRLIDLFHEAKALPAGASRDQFVDASCGEDERLRARLLRLLAADESAGEFLTPTPLDRQSVRITERPGDRIDRYKLLEKIGEGGCGVVYLAEQEQPVRRRVALKIIKLGMDTRQVVGRFEAERQALALMDHANIAKVFDGGATETGRPYFVMEAVRGIKITEFCDQNELSTEQRVDLFIQVCQAIQHAHQKGIIHRDIKPSNILVTVNDGVPVPKVIDFGIAKAIEQTLTEKTVYTAFEQFIGTPAYMSPEQAEMTTVDIDTRSDIYSLGVLLYELLTGHTPFTAEGLLAAGLSEMRRIIRESEPANPSARLNTLTPAELTTVAKRRASDAPQLVHRVRGDLDWIAMKCLEKDRARRYETASGLAADLRRHLADEPVLARPPSRSYRVRKLVRRNKLAFGTGAAIACALIAGLGLSTWLFVRERAALRLADENAIRAEDQADQAERLRGVAEAEANRSQQVSRFLQEMLEGVAPSVAAGRDTTMLRAVLDQTVMRLAELKNQPGVEADLRETLGKIYTDLGEYQTAIAMHREAVRLRKELLGSEHADVAESLYRLGDALNRYGRELKTFAEAEDAFRESLSIQRARRGNEGREVASLLHALGSVLLHQGKTLAAEENFRASLATRRNLLGNEHPDVGQSLISLAACLMDQNKLGEAEEKSREALALFQKRDGDESGVARALRSLGIVLVKQRKPVEAESPLRRAVAIQRKLLGSDHPDVARSLVSLGHSFLAQDKYAEAETTFGEALLMRQKMLGPVHTNVAELLFDLGMTFLNQDKNAEAAERFREALAMRRELLSGQETEEVVSSLVWLREALLRQGKHAEADAIYLEQLQIRNKLPDKYTQSRPYLAGLTDALLAAERFPEAESVARECLAMCEEQTPDSWGTFNVRSMLGGSLLGQKRYSEAEPLLLSGYEGIKQREDQIKAPGRPQFRKAIQRLVQFYEATRQPEAAAEWKGKLAEFDKAEATKRPGVAVKP